MNRLSYETLADARTRDLERLLMWLGLGHYVVFGPAKPGGEPAYRQRLIRLIQREEKRLDRARH